jgi:7-carboxy-7-deazaguanine synthase
MDINEIYLTYNGEVNAFGIGSPTIFVRTQGCHLRCYLKTMGTLCDTPNSLEKPTKMVTNKYHDTGGTLTQEQVESRLIELRNKTGVNRICLTGGDPLWRDSQQLHNFFKFTEEQLFKVTVETSGTIDWRQYKYENVYWVLDYKLESAGIKINNLSGDSAYIANLRKEDYIKFVVYDKEDMDEALAVIKSIYRETDATLAIGPYWGGKIKIWEIFKRIEQEGLLGSVVMNFQTHKLMMLEASISVSSIDVSGQI